MEDVKSVATMLQEIAEDMCNNYCKYPHQHIPDGKDEDWLTEDPESPCQKCPLNRLS